MKLFSILLFCYPVFLAAQGTPPIIKGLILDYETKKPISLVSIKYEDKIIFTDINGNFEIKTHKKTNQLYLSHIAYYPLKVKIEGKQNKNLKIYIRPKQFFLGEIKVVGKSYKSAKDVIEKVAVHLNENMISKPYTATAYFHTLRKKNDKYVFFAEAKAKHFNEAYSGIGISFNITFPLEYRISDQDNSFESIGKYKFPCTQGLACRYNQILLPIILNKSFTFECADTIFIEKKAHLLINYRVLQNQIKKTNKQHPFFVFYPGLFQYGTILVNAQNFTVHQIIHKGSSISPFANNNSVYVTAYTFKNIRGTNFLSKYESILTNKVKSTATDIDILYKKTIIEFNNFDTNQLSIQQIENQYNCKVSIRSFKDGDYRYFIRLPAPKKKESKYREDYWLTQAKPKDWNNIKTDLKELSDIDINLQFKKNSEYLISRSKFMKLRKQVDKKNRGVVSDLYKYYLKNSFFND